MKPNVVIVSPATAAANNGNWHTAARWGRFLSELCAVDIVESWRHSKACPNLLIALHARKSAQSIREFRAVRKQGGLVVALTGTDVYRDIHESDAAMQSLELADRLLVLQAAALEELPARFRKKSEVLYQSARFLRRLARPTLRFQIVQVGHLRHEKDPFTPITALRHLPQASQIRLTQIGATTDQKHLDAMNEVVRDEPRLRWLGELTRGETRQRIKRSHLLVLASKLEGGANVIVEAVTAGVPVIASDISGNRGMLGDDYPGFFPFGDAKACAALMLRAETDKRFYQSLDRACAKRAQLFAPHLERAALHTLLSRMI